jgi:hypothetical protein
MQRVNARMASAARKNPGHPLRGDEGLRQQLEYFDLRELQDLIVGKATWPSFEPIFATKESLDVRFSQAAELRNAIRHSRIATDVTIKDGEAAILWFEQTLKAALAAPDDIAALGESRPM